MTAIVRKGNVMSEESILPEAIPTEEKRTSKVLTHIKRAIKPTKSNITVLVSVLAFATAGTSTFMSWNPYFQYRSNNPGKDGFVQPRSIGDLVNQVQYSTVTIFCDYGADMTSQGTGWAIKLKTSHSKRYPTTLITNYHVIEDCLNGAGKIYIQALDGKEYPALVDKWDKKNDLAVIATKVKLKPLTLSRSIPWPGYWIMAVGTADGYQGSVAFGNVLNIIENEVLITAAISHGNSGGPLIDNEGNVVGTNSWGRKGEQYNGAKSLDAMCAKIIDCDGKTWWDWEN